MVVYCRYHDFRSFQVATQTSRLRESSESVKTRINAMYTSRIGSLPFLFLLLLLNMNSYLGGNAKYFLLPIPQLCVPRSLTTTLQCFYYSLSMY